MLDVLIQRVRQNTKSIVFATWNSDTSGATLNLSPLKWPEKRADLGRWRVGVLEHRNATHTVQVKL